IPIQVTAQNAKTISYNFPYEQISYNTTQANPLIVVYGPFPQEAQKVLFIDDFLYTNPLLESSWTIDRYTTNTNAGISTTSRYLIMAAQTSSVAETVHVTTPIYDSSQYASGMQIKRKMTVSLIPFTKNESYNAQVTTGLAPLLTTGVFPGIGPQGTPAYATCPTTDTLGSTQILITNTGTVTAVNCYNLNGTPFSNPIILETVNPTLYTVLTIETSGVFCSTCPQNILAGTAWIYYRIYQRNINGNLIASTDKNLNITTNITPLYQTLYAFITQSNFNSAATGQVSKIDLVQVQNYGSPVCLSVPGGILCTRLPPIPNGLGQGVISDIAWLASQIGFGDEQIGAIIMFLVLSTGFAFVPFILTRNYLIGGTGLLLVFSFFIYAGFLPTWMLFIPILFGGVLGVLLVNRLLGSHSLMGGGGSDSQ